MCAAVMCAKRPLSHFEELSAAKRFCTSSSWLSPPISSDFYNPFQPPSDENLASSSAAAGANFYPHPKRIRSTSQLSPPEANTGYNPFSQTPADLSVEDQEWAETVVNEMKNASNLDDARTRAVSVLHNYKNTILSPREAAMDDLQKENAILKEQTEALNHENGILKRAVVIQHERQKEADSMSQELQHQKQLVRQLELEKYALMVRLKQAEQSAPMPSHFHPHVF